jgi:two-component system, cell cycle response regulator
VTDESKRTQRFPTMPSDPAPPVVPRSPRPTYANEWQDEESSTRNTDAAIALPPVAPGKQQTRAVLTMVNGPTTGRAYSVEGVTVLGRGRDATIRIDDAGVSREHTRITPAVTGQFMLEDLGSLNGTYVDGRRVQRAELHSGDRIHIGPNVVLTFAILDVQAERIAHQLYESSVRDALTRAFNRRYLVERLASEIAYSSRHKTDLGLILFDLDHFKRVNDTHGHLAGDDVLRDVAALVQRMIRVEDVFARFGGEEFVVLVRGIEHVNVGRFAERLRMGVERLEVASEAQVLKVTVSVGYASFSELAPSERAGDALLRLADERLYKSKEEGRNRVTGA